MKIVYLAYHFNSVDGQHQNRILEDIEDIKSFLDARASEVYLADVEELVASIASMTAGQCKYLDIDHGDWVTITCVETPSTILNDGEEMALKHEENGTDFILTGERCYITVNNLTVHVKKDDEGVAIDVWPLHDENDESIASTWALYSEGEKCDDEDADKEYDVIVYFFDVDEDPTTPYAEENYTITASSEAQAKHEAIQKAYAESEHARGNFSTDAKIN